MSEEARSETAVRAARQGVRRVWMLNVLVASASITLMLTVVRGLPTRDAPFHIAWPLLAAAFAIAEVCVVHLEFRRDAYSFSLSEVPLVLGLFFLSPANLVLAQVVGAVGALSLHRRQSPLKLAFNVGLFSLQAQVAALAFHAVAGAGTAADPRAWAGAFLGTVLSALVSGVLIATAIWLSAGEGQLRASLQVLGFGLIGTVTNTALALVAVTTMWADPWSGTLILVPAITLFLAYRAYVRQRERRESVEFLYEAMRILDHPGEVEQALVELLSHTRTMFRAEIAEIVLVSGETALRTRMGPDETFEALQPVDAETLRGLVGLVPADAPGLLLARPAHDPAAHEALRSLGLRDAMVAPLRGQERDIGVMVVANRLGDVSTFDAGDLRLFEALANHVSISLERGRLGRTLEQLTELEEARARLLEKVVQVAEDERTRLSGELHDGPIQRLTALSYHVERVALHLGRGDLPGALDILEPIRAQLRGEIQALRRLMVELRPPILDERGLEIALLEYAQEFRAGTGVGCSVQTEIGGRFSPARETILYRLAQEALTNVGKHARASQVWISLRVEGDRVVLKVSDDGVGFDPHRRSEDGSHHFGLAVMRERVEMAGGTWELRSAPGSGTTIVASVPLEDVARHAHPADPEVRLVEV